MKLTEDVLNAIKDHAKTDANHLVLTGPRFTSKLYQQVNDVLEAVGGRWTTTVQAHVFPCDADDALAPVLASGEVVTLREKRQQAQYFPTPAPIVQRLVGLAELEAGMEVLEPSAGSGAVAAAVAAAGATVDCIERDPGYAAVLTDTGFARTVRVADFLAVPSEPRYDRVMMNPPFTMGADMRHVEHALRFLKPDGLLVSVMSWTVTENSRKTAAFRSLVEARGGTVEAVAERAFAESGTNVSTVIVAIPAARRVKAAPTVWPGREQQSEAVEELADPLTIANEIRANLLTALREIDAVAASLAKPATLPRTAEVVELPAPRQEQLSLGIEEAS